MATKNTNDLPPWDKSNVEESQPVIGSIYEEQLNKFRASLCKSLQLDPVWEHLRELEVINWIRENKIKVESTGQERVVALLDLISNGSRWQYHGFMRSVAMSGQSELIPEGEIDMLIYEGNVRQDEPLGCTLKKLPEPIKESVPPATSIKPTFTSIPPATLPRPTSSKLSILPHRPPKPPSTQGLTLETMPPKPTTGEVSVLTITPPNPTTPQAPPPRPPKSVSSQVPSARPPKSISPQVPSATQSKSTLSQDLPVTCTSLKSATSQVSVPPTIPPRPPSSIVPEVSEQTLPPSLALPPRSTSLSRVTTEDVSPTPPLPPGPIPTLPVKPVPRRLPPLPPSSPTHQAADTTRMTLPLYPWDKRNMEELVPVLESVYGELLNRSRVNLYNNLQLGCIWPHLRQLHVLKLTDEERLKATGKSRPDQVLELLNFIERGPRWHYHALMRALALTGQANLIPKGGVGLSIYLEGVQCDVISDAVKRPLPSSLLQGIFDHCQHCKRSLMKANVFNVENSQREDMIDICECLVHVKPHVKMELSHINGSYVVAVPIDGTQILQEFGGTSAPRTIILYADPGEGKTTFGKSFVFKWSTNVLDQIINQGGTLSLKDGSTKWTTMVFLKAKSITTTVEAAIRKQLGCKKEQEDELIAHIQHGDGVVIVVDSLNELHNSAALEKLEHYIQDCQKRRGPTIVITCSTDLCSIDARFFDRHLMLKGYTEMEGLRYVKVYTEMCETRKLTQPSQCHFVQDYVNRHKQKLKAFLSNPLRLHIFCALAVRGELDLSEQSEFNIPKLLGAFERHLLKRAGVKVNKEQAQDFYRMCFFLLVNDLKEFNENLLVKFNIVPSYKIFLIQTKDERPQLHYSFSYELMLEYFASQYIYTLDSNKRTSFLLAICSDPYLRGAQRIVFQLLLQDENSQRGLLQMMVRSMLILQSLPYSAQGGIKGKLYRFKLTLQFKKSKRIHYDLISLGEKIKQLTSDTIENILHSKDYKIKDVHAICERIDLAFDRYAEVLRGERWVYYINENGTFHHIVELLKLCSASLRDTLVQSTMYSLMPGMFTNVYGDETHIYPTGGTRWAEVKTEGTSEIELSVTAWCPKDAFEAIVQHAHVPTDCRWDSQNIYLRQRTSYDNIWGEPEEDSWRKERWDKLLQVKPEEGLRMLWIFVNENIPLAGLLASLVDGAAQFPDCEVMVPYGTVRLADLVTCASGSQRKGLQLTLSSVRIVLSQGLRDQKDLLREMIATCEVVCQNMVFVTETGENINLDD